MRRWPRNTPRHKRSWRSFRRKSATSRPVHGVREVLDTVFTLRDYAFGGSSSPTSQVLAC
jgi:hypothetical protein